MVALVWHVWKLFQFLSSFFPSVNKPIYKSLSVCPFVHSCVRKVALFPAVVWQNVSNKSCLVCGKIEKYAFWVTLRPRPCSPWGKEKLSYVYYVIRQGEAKLHISKLTSVFHHHPNVSSKQLCALAHLGYTREAGKYFLVFEKKKNKKTLCLNTVD